MSKTPAEYLNRFKDIYRDGPPNQGEVGHRPAAYIFAAFVQFPNDPALRKAATELAGIEPKWPYNLAFSGNGIDRKAVADICGNSNVDEIVAYCFAMAWGNQWDASSYKSFVQSLKDIGTLRRRLKELRDLSFPTTPAN